MKLNITFCYSRYKNKLIEYESILKLIAKKVFQKHKSIDRKEIIFDCSFVSNNKIKQLNKQYRNIDKETDVISFALWDCGFKTDLLGELYICYNKIVQQAKEYKHSFKREICFLFTHGLLHLLGYDHNNVDDEKIMFSLQEEILNELGITR